MNRQIRTKEELRKFVAEKGLRTDWHEPDESGLLDAHLEGSHVDNASPHHSDEMNVVLMFEDGNVEINLANLLGWATE